MNVRHQRNRNPRFDFRKGFSRRFVRHRHADDVTASLGQRRDLVDRLVHIARIGVAHRLNGDWMVAADDHIANLNCSRFSSVNLHLFPLMQIPQHIVDRHHNRENHQARKAKAV